MKNNLIYQSWHPLALRKKNVPGLTNLFIALSNVAFSLVPFVGRGKGDGGTNTGRECVKAWEQEPMSKRL